VTGTLVLLRHGETEWSRAGRHTGRTDIPLTPDGEARAAAAAPLLRGLVVGLVLCSPLVRARQTARLAGLEPDEFDADLLEWDYGAWEGRTTSDIRVELGDPTWVIWDHPVPRGVTDGEQPADVAARSARAIARAEPVLAEGHDVVFVAHGHLLRILTATWLGLAPDAGRLFALSAGAVSHLGHEHEQRVIAAWNLEPAPPAPPARPAPPA
jgi:probable phosphoglycerate mutase